MTDPYRGGLTKGQANAIYDLLVEHAGAVDRWRDYFVDAQTGGWCDEFRLTSDLGFGGKFWRDPNHPGHGTERTARETWRVTCYPEDETPERREAIKLANAALADLNTRVGPTQDPR